MYNDYDGRVGFEELGTKRGREVAGLFEVGYRWKGEKVIKAQRNMPGAKSSTVSLVKIAKEREWGLKLSLTIVQITNKVCCHRGHNKQKKKSQKMIGIESMWNQKRAKRVLICGGTSEHPR